MYALLGLLIVPALWALRAVLLRVHYQKSKKNFVSARGKRETAAPLDRLRRLPGEIHLLLARDGAGRSRLNGTDSQQPPIPEWLELRQPELDRWWGLLERHGLGGACLEEVFIESGYFWKRLASWPLPLRWHVLLVRLRPDLLAVVAGTAASYRPDPNELHDLSFLADAPLRSEAGPAANKLPYQALVHDMRLPLAHLQRMHRRWLAGESPDLAALGRQLRYLDELTEAILIVDQAGAAVARSGPVDPGAELDLALADHAELIQEWRIRVERNEAGKALCSCDPAAVRRILWNLLHNAIKFSPAGGVLWLETRLRPRVWALDLEDSGPGLDATRDDPRSGHGVGLVAARYLARQAGGRLIAAPPRFSKGARFLLVLPSAG